MGEQHSLKDGTSEIKTEEVTESVPEDTEPESYLDEEMARKKAAADALREQETFMVVGQGDAVCGKCGYNYLAAEGDKEFPIPPGTSFMDTPDEYYCPLCGAPKSEFKSSAKTVAGFAANQGYGFGTNSMTSGQKQGLIYGALILFFFLFLGGYFLD